MTDLIRTNCEEQARGFPLVRREFLRSSLAGLLGLCLGERSTLPASAAIPSKPSRPKSCILLWMDGGPSQLETWNPKPGSANAGPTKTLKTPVEGVLISEHLPRMAERMEEVALIRSMVTREGSHDRAKYLGHTGYSPQPTIQFPSLGAMVSEEIGDREANLPQFVSILSPSYGGGFLGAEHSPFVVPNPLRKVENLTLPRGVDRERFARRLRMLDRVERRFAADHPGVEIRNHHGNYAQTVRFMNAPETSAFDLSAESESARNAYGMTEFGQGCLLARRLVETGVRFVEVSLRGWDTHQDNFTRAQKLCGELDPALDALIADLMERDLWDSTLVVWMGEFGRTPKINGNEGRDHFTRGWCALLGGCGVPGGLALGRTSEDGEQVTDRPIAIKDLLHTVLRLLDIDPAAEFLTPAKRPITLVEKGAVGIPEILGSA
ncbi:MAG: hypothetical protein GHCLOJNM_01130 [bacterium]|nr:hypothetical protein [bacterium]